METRRAGAGMDVIKEMYARTTTIYSEYEVSAKGSHQ